MEERLREEYEVSKSEMEEFIDSVGKFDGVSLLDMIDELNDAVVS